MIEIQAKVLLESLQKIGIRKDESTSFAPVLFFENSGGVEIQTLVLTDESSKVFERILEVMNRIPTEFTNLNFESTVVLADGRQLGGRDNADSSNVSTIFLLNAAEVEIASLPLTSSELRQLLYIVGCANRTPADIV